MRSTELLRHQLIVRSSLYLSFDLGYCFDQPTWFLLPPVYWGLDFWMTPGSATFPCSAARALFRIMSACLFSSAAASASLFLLACLVFRELQKHNPNIRASNTPPTTPTPIPIFAPLVRPPCDTAAVGRLVEEDDVVGSEVVVAGLLLIVCDADVEMFGLWVEERVRIEVETV